MATVKYLPKSGNPQARKPFTLRYWDDRGQHERSFVTSAERKDYAVKFEHDSRESMFVDPRADKADFIAAIQAWIARHPGSEGTKANYRSVLARHIGPAFTGRSLAQVAGDRDGVTRFLTVTMPARVCAARVGLARTAILGTIGEAVRAGKLPPVHRLDGIEIAVAGTPHREFIPATHAELVTLTGSLDRRDLVLAVWLMRGCGLRVSEALAVNLRNFRDSGRTLRLREQTETDGSALRPLKHRKAGDFRDVPVPAWLWAMVQAHLAEFGTPVDGYLFHGSGRLPYVGYAPFGRTFKRAAQKAGLPGAFAFHQLRHAYATAALEHGVQIHELSEWMGHGSVDVTVKTYGHLLAPAWDRGRAALEEEFQIWSSAAV
jgi:integrase